MRVKLTPEQQAQNFMMAVLLRQTHRLKTVFKLDEKEIEQLYSLSNSKWAAQRLVMGVKQPKVEKSPKATVTKPSQPAVTASFTNTAKLKSV
ncbi:hypothetical protein [Mangrovibacter yixingensis]|uniref:hypothetical protein n=1 Tax=Mangrovibacter yixingensis TaxID=1529639 RepID=UPI001CF9421D|nr:hypothetical protein [Mangrovibacter yixingensis]